MRIIPKKINVKMEFFRGIGVADVIVLAIGGALSAAFLLSDLPFHIILFCVVLLITIAIVVPIDDEKGYMSLLHLMVYLARDRQFGELPQTEETPETEEKKGKFRRKAKKEKKLHSVKDITPFTGINGKFIEYGDSYSAMVLRVSSLEFRFYTEEKQNMIIDRVFSGVLRSTSMDETITLMKLDQPIVFDSYIRSEQEKLRAVKEAYLNGLYTDDELTRRVGIIQDRITQIQALNEKDPVYVPFHYIVFYLKDREQLVKQVENAKEALDGVEMEAKILSGPELAIFLKYNYTVEFNEREAYELSPEQYLDWILPKNISFTPRTTQYDGLITHNFRVTKYPTLVGNAWGARLFNMPNTRVVMELKPLDRYKSIRQIDRAMEEISEQSGNTGKASKQIELNTHMRSLAQTLRLLQGENEILFGTNLYVTVYDYPLRNEMAKLTGEKGERKPSSDLKKKIRRDLAEDGFRVNDMFLQQFEGYLSAGVSARDALESEEQSIHSSSVAAVFPYVYKHLLDKGGIYIGNSGGVPAFVNFFMRTSERVNSNMVIVGKSGSGKSYATKTMLTHLAAENSKIFILDPENEYTKMAENFNGKIIDVGSATQGRLNPFHIITNLTDEEGEEEGRTSFNTHLQFLEEFYRQILPGIESDALEYLNNITVRMYEEKGIDAETDIGALKPEDFPTFDDLYDKLLNDFQLTNGEYSKNLLRVLINYVSKFATGGRNAQLWNGPASISTQENFIVFNFQSLLANKNNTIANAQMLLVLKWLDNEIIKNRDYNMKYSENRKIIIVIDEAHVFIDDKYPIALDFMFQLAKRIRKYNGMQIVITQNIRDFVGTEEIARKSTAIINASQYSFIFPLAPNDMHDLVKLYEKSGAINESEQQDIVNNGRGRAFLITSPSERCCVDIIASPDIERLFTM